MISHFTFSGHPNWRGSCSAPPTPPTAPLKNATLGHTKHVANFLFAFGIRRTRYATRHSFGIRCSPNSIHTLGLRSGELRAGEKWKCTLLCLCLPSTDASDALALPPDFRHWASGFRPSTLVQITLFSCCIFTFDFHGERQWHENYYRTEFVALKPQIAPTSALLKANQRTSCFPVYLLAPPSKPRVGLLQSTVN